MPGGIGPISGDVEKSLSRGSRTSGLSSRATPVQIFYNLGVGRVHYRPIERDLYFVESANTSVLSIVHSACQSLPDKPEPEQLFLDRHGLYKGALRMTLTQQQANLILVALRLAGTRIDLARE